MITRIFFFFILLVFLVISSGCNNKNGRTNSLLSSKVEQKNPDFNQGGSSVPLEKSGKIKSEELKNQEDLRAIRVIYFDYDNATVSSEFRQVLEAHAGLLCARVTRQSSEING